MNSKISLDISKFWAFALLCVFCMVAFNSEKSECVHFPAFDVDAIHDALVEHGHHEDAKNIREKFPYAATSQARTTKSLFDFPLSNFTQLVRTAKLMEPNAPQVGLERIQREWPQFWLESRAPFNYSLKVYLPDADGNYGIPILQFVGQFNTTTECRFDLGCVFFNRRSTSTVNFTDGSLSPPVFDQALFIPTNPGESVGVDIALSGSGVYGEAGYTVFGPQTNIPVFRNVVNRGGLLTADTFSTDISPIGGDAGVGANYYWKTTTTDPVTQQSVAHIKIQSAFHILDPVTKAVLLLGDQRTTTSFPISGLPI